MPISKVHSSFGSNNFGSCNKLVTYLNKENRDLDYLISKSTNIEEITKYINRKIDFFSHNKGTITQLDVLQNILWCLGCMWPCCIHSRCVSEHPPPICSQHCPQRILHFNILAALPPAVILRLAPCC